MSDGQLSVSDAARALTEETGQQIRPRDITLLFYYRELRDDLAPIVAGRRIIDRRLLPEIARALRRRGWVRRDEQLAR